MGLMGRDVLHGQFPFFFYGQPFMGAVDGYAHAVPLALLGESAAPLRVSVLVSLDPVLVAALLAHRIFRAGWWTLPRAIVSTPPLLRPDGRVPPVVGGRATPARALTIVAEWRAWAEPGARHGS